MAGIYIHVPFCKSRCIYCGFFSAVSLERRDEYVEKVCRELEFRKDYLKGEDIKTIYFGGGTPSQLSTAQLKKILDAVLYIYNVREGAEITLEGNPDDLTLDFLHEVRLLGFNRLSMGVQTFDDERLKFLHRRHSAEQALVAVENARKAGFENMSIDLMFGFPNQTLDEWKQDVSKAVNLGVEHISAYSLMYEDGTQLASKLDKGEIAEVDDELSLRMYQHLVEALRKAGYEHYEISNFAKPSYRSRHNSSYWHGVPYLGVGAGAHSFDGVSRQYNVDSLKGYLPGEEQIREELTESEKYNEYIFTGLRTCDGVALDELLSKLGKVYYDYCILNAEKHILSGKLILDSNGNGKILRLSSTGIFVSNDIMSDLMYVE